MAATRARKARCAQSIATEDETGIKQRDGRSQITASEQVAAPQSLAQSMVSSKHDLLPCCTFSQASGSSSATSNSWGVFEFVTSYGFVQFLMVLVLVAAFTATQLAPPERPADIIFDLLDLDSDGVLTASELSPAAIDYIEGIRQLQPNDGTLSVAELKDLRLRSFFSEVPKPGFRPVVAMIATSLDKNKDQQLDKSELPQFIIQFVESVDKNVLNDNGMLDVSELRGPGLWYWLNGEAWWRLSSGMKA